MTKRAHPPAMMTVQPPARRRGAPNANKARGLRERAWWLIRTLGKPFTIDDLLFTLAGGGERDAAGNVGRYLRQLERASVLRRLPRRAPGRALTSNGAVIWRLANDLGPRAPVFRTARTGLWDPNAQRLLPLDFPPAVPAAEPCNEEAEPCAI